MGQLQQVQEQIEKQKSLNDQKIKEQEEQIQLKLIKEEESARDKKQKQEEILRKYSANAKSLKEANEIVKLMGKRIKFKQCIIQVMVKEDKDKDMQFEEDSSDDDDILNLNQKNREIREELQIRVQNYEKNSVVMWTIPQFQDKLEMMRDALAQFEV